MACKELSDQIMLAHHRMSRQLLDAKTLSPFERCFVELAAQHVELGHELGDAAAAMLEELHNAHRAG